MAAFFHLKMNVADFYKIYFRPGMISTDSRHIREGSVFIALRGENFNGNEFAISALQAGATVAVVDEKINTSDYRIILVENTLSFLQDLAHYHRIKNGFRIIGLTGTNGKTTTKELILAVLSEKFRVQATKGNLNNHVGVPLTLLSLDPKNEYCIVEMGANHKGEIKTLCSIAEPDSGLITNIGKAHLEGFGSFEGVIEAKSELRDFIVSRKGKLYCNASDTLLHKIAGDYWNCVFYNSENSMCSGKIVSSVPYLVTEIADNNKSTTIINSHLHGDYNLTNILAATCIGLDLGIDLDKIKIGIEKYQPSNFRSQLIQIGSATVIMDCYNANPSSMELALLNASKFMSNRKIIILGSMKELGDFSQNEHKKLADFAESFGFQQVILFGEEFSGITLNNGITTESFEKLVSYLTTMDLQHSLILIKGSRANRLERLENVIINHHSLRS